MKLNIGTILIFALLLSAGFSTRSNAQAWRYDRYGHCPYMDTSYEKNFEHYGPRGYMPRRFYRRMMWCGDTTMYGRSYGRPYRWNRWEDWKEAEANFDKYNKEMDERREKYMDDMKKDEKEWHEHWKDDRWDGDYGWRRWHRRWYDRYYYRGGGY